MRSNTPPCPGISWLLSLILHSRLNILSVKSPNIEIATVQTESPIKSAVGKRNKFCGVS